MKTSSFANRTQWRLPAKSMPFVFAFYMSAIMSLLMTLVITAANTGINALYLEHVVAAYKLAMPVAFCCVLCVRPLAMKLVSLSIHPT